MTFVQYLTKGFVEDFSEPEFTGFHIVILSLQNII